MTDRLRPDEFVPYAGSEGVTVNINHCKQGKDNARLYITTKSDRILAYCHHCGRRGCHYLANYARARTRGQGGTDGIHSSRNSKFRGREIVSSEKYITEINQWPAEARHWIGRAGLTQAEVEQFNIGYYEPDQRVMLPIYNKGELVGYQMRRIFAHDNRPKYDTRKKVKPLLFYNEQHDDSNRLVIVEDILSAIKVGRQYNTCALLGTNLDLSSVAYIAGKYDNVDVWLDNDNRQVKLNQVKLKRKLGAFCNVRVIKTDIDPKLLTDAEIYDIIFLE